MLRNYPNYLRDFRRPDGDRIDLAAIDVLRDRERGVPRYNRLRELLHLPPVHSFEQMAGDGVGKCPGAKIDELGCHRDGGCGKLTAGRTGASHRRRL